jgi:hypothetical protein
VNYGIATVNRERFHCQLSHTGLTLRTFGRWLTLSNSVDDVVDEKITYEKGCGRCLSEIEEPHVLGVDDNPMGMHYVPLCQSCFDELADWYDNPQLWSRDDSPQSPTTTQEADQ